MSLLAPEAIAFFSSPLRSSFWPRSAVKQMTSQPP